MRVLGVGILGVLFSVIFPILALAQGPAVPAGFSESQCASKKTNKEYQYLCDKNGTLRIQQSLFDTGRPSLVYEFNDKGRLIEMRTFNYEGEPVQYNTYVPQTDGSYLVYNDGLISAQLEITFSPGMKTRNLKTWNYNDKKLSFVDFFQKSSGEEPYRTETYDRQGQLERVYQFKHALVDGIFKVIKSFVQTSPDGTVVGRFDGAKKRNFKPTSDTRQPVVVIDTGFDVFHPEISRALSKEFPGEYDDPQLLRMESTEINEIAMLSADRKPPFPISHGTHVASVAFEDIQKFSLVGFAGDYSQAEYLDYMSDFIAQHRVPFVNMSFGFGTRENPFGVNEESRFALLDLMHANPETLFVIAAGNGTLAVDPDMNDDLPASAQVDNKLVIAAVNRSAYAAWTDQDRETLQLTSFSNYGIDEVDLAAPGEDVSGALLGGGYVRLSGTSMASPMALNTVMKIKEINQKLTGHDIKEILCDTAFIPKEPLRVRCKGVIDEGRALQAAQLSLKMDLPTAILNAMK